MKTLIIVSLLRAAGFLAFLTSSTYASASNPLLYDLLASLCDVTLDTSCEDRTDLLAYARRVEKQAARDSWEDPNDDNAYKDILALTVLLHLKLRMTMGGETSDYLEKLEDMYPAWAFTHYAKGGAAIFDLLEKEEFADAGKREKVAKHFEEALKLDPTFAEAYWGLAILAGPDGLARTNGYLAKYAELYGERPRFFLPFREDGEVKYRNALRSLEETTVDEGASSGFED